MDLLGSIFIKTYVNIGEYQELDVDAELRDFYSFENLEVVENDKMMSEIRDISRLHKIYSSLIGFVETQRTCIKD